MQTTHDLVHRFTVADAGTFAGSLGLRMVLVTLIPDCLSAALRLAAGSTPASCLEAIAHKRRPRYSSTELDPSLQHCRQLNQRSFL